MTTLAAAAETFASRLSHVSVTLLVVAVALHVAGLLLRATAWWSVLSAAVPSRRAPWRGVTGAYLAGTGVNNVIPARGGDVARVVLATRTVPGACCPTIASSLLVETLLDTLIGAGLIVWAVSTGALPFALLRTQLPGGSWTLVAAALAVPIALVVAACLVRDRAAAALAEARRGFAILSSPRAYLVRVALPQVMAWMLRVLAMYCFLHAFHIDGQMNHAALALLAG
ncbi:MAG TPA: lysylphosphatidylglycerol synthase domain-containing protein, partial [Gaiellales bacterium]|nr:lysylphosphatidylglycerol synthase domain-containing protein [Gaiellales bacterium]